MDKATDEAGGRLEGVTKALLVATNQKEAATNAKRQRILSADIADFEMQERQY
jgi:hypothetical protein